jgi:hypothetical protein
MIRRADPYRGLLAAGLCALAMAAVIFGLGAVIVAPRTDTGAGMTAGNAAGGPDGDAGTATPTPPGQATATPASSPSATPPRATTPATTSGAPGFPSAANTGVPKGKKLKQSPSLRIRKAGTVIDGYDIRGEVSVEADNVRIVNTRIVNSGDYAIIQRPGHGGLVVENSEIRGDGTHVLTKAIFNIGGMLTVRRSNISRISDGVFTTHGLIEDNFLHSPGDFDGEHIDMIQADGGPAAGLSLVIRHNTIINTVGQTSAVAISGGDRPSNNILIERNLLAGGGYTLYAGDGKSGGSHDVRVIGNVWSRDVFPKGGYWGAVVNWESGGSGNVWRDNVWAGTGEPVKP